MVKEIDVMYRLNENALPEWAAEFEPNLFQQTHKDIKLGDWRLTNEQLE